MDTVVNLYKCLKNNNRPDASICHDFFGKKNLTSDHIAIILGCYKDLYMQNIPINIFHKCFINNKLDELIHKKHTFCKNDYYDLFVKKNIVIGNTFKNYKYFCELDEDEIEVLKMKNLIPDEVDETHKFYFTYQNDITIYDDDHCPTCNIKGYCQNNLYKCKFCTQ